ncbi:MAG TPA: SipW-dependent-type signal peptide-containing protein [Chloroflexota bacterium]|nr:SipW-dependent-type signal peptide-containing protein [Chloroflexota bacterium]
MDVVAARLTGAASWRVLLGLVLVLGVVSAQSGGGTLAFFTSSATSSANTFSAGTVSIKLSNDNTTFSSSVSGSIAGSTLTPGAPAFLAGFFVVKDDGTLPINYALSTADDGSVGSAGTALASALKVALDKTTAGTACNASSGSSGSQSNIVAETDLLTLAIGSVSSGAVTGGRPLAASAAERLCFYVRFPLGTEDNSAQGGTAKFKFTVNAENQ